MNQEKIKNVIFDGVLNSTEVGIKIGEYSEKATTDAEKRASAQKRMSDKKINNRPFEKPTVQKIRNILAEKVEILDGELNS